MKYNIHGFYQPRAVELGLTNDDLLVLRWFVDFAGTNKMKTIVESDGIYYWVNYTTILEDLPVLKITKDTLRRKHFIKLCECGVLKHKHIKQGGSFSYYAYGINYETLIYLQDETPTGKLTEGTEKLTEGSVENVGTVTGKLTEGYGKINGTKINLLNNPSINNTINNKFVKPTVKEVEQYCKERNNNINAEQFIDHYTSNGWKVGKTPMKDWKAAIRTWERRSKEVENARSVRQSNRENESKLYEQFS